MNKHPKIKVSKWAGACIAAAAATFGYVGSAQALTCNTGFNNYAAIHAANDDRTFVYAPYYNQSCGTIYTATVAENPAGDVLNHFHLMYENACVKCLIPPDNAEFGLDRECAGIGIGCMAIDNDAYWRFAASMSHGQMITTTVSPNPGQWCVTTLLGTVSCVSTVGKPFTPITMVVRGGPGAGDVDLYVTRLTTMQYGQPAKIDRVIRLPAGHIYDLTSSSLGLGPLGVGLVDQLTVTGAAGGDLNFQYDNLIIRI